MSTNHSPGWHFSPHAVECTGFGGTGGRTFDSMESIAREAAQNCLGARKDQSKPINVEITRRLVSKSDIPYIGDYEAHLNAAKQLIEANPNTGNITDSGSEINRALEILASHDISCLTIRDSNTVGLEGAHGETQGRLFRFLSSTGISQDVGDSAGSHGLGKNSLIAGSKLGCFLFFSRTEDRPNGFFAGRCDIGTHFHPYSSEGESGERETLAGVGYLVASMTSKMGGVYPFAAEENEYPEELKTIESGTCITIPGFAYDEDWVLSTIRAIVSGFNLAVHERKIEFDIVDEIAGCNYTINKESLSRMTDWCINEGIDQNTEGFNTLSAVKKTRLGTSWGMTKCLEPDNANNVFTFEKELDLLGLTKAVFYYDKRNTRLNNKYFILRLASMNIFDSGSSSLRGFGGYVQCISEEGNKIIKDLEDPTHTSFRDPSKIKNQRISSSEYRRVKSVLNSFARECLSQIQPRTEETGEINELEKFLPSQKGGFQNTENSLGVNIDGNENDQPGVEIFNEEEMEWKTREEQVKPQTASYEGQSEESGNKGVKNGSPRHKKSRSASTRPRENITTEETGIPSPEDSNDQQSTNRICINDIRYKLFKLPASEANNSCSRIGINILPSKSGELSLTLSLAGEKTDNSDKETSMNIDSIIKSASIDGLTLPTKGSTISQIKCIKDTRQLLTVDLDVSTDYAFYLN